MRGRLTLPHRLRNPLAIGTIALLGGLLIAAIVFPPLLGQHAREIHPESIELGPSWQHPFGTDGDGRDVFSRVLVATRLSVGLALLATLIGCSIGVVLGSLPLLIGRRLGRLVVGGFNLLVAFPGLLLAMFLALVFGVGARGAVLALSFGIAPFFARLTHTTASGIAGADYMSAAKLLGVSRGRTLTRHLLPNSAEPLLINATGLVGTVLLSMSALSYLGFGVQPPDYDWGRMLSDGLPNIYTNPAAALGPCLAIVIAGIAFVLAGELLTQLVADQSGPIRPRRAADAAEVAAAVPDQLGPSGPDDVLGIENLSVSFPRGEGRVEPVTGVSFAVGAGEIVGVVGESGSGKSLTALAASNLITSPGEARADAHRLRGEDLESLGRGERDRLLGTSLAMMFQDPMSALNPVIRVGRQLAEVSQVHGGLGRKQALERAVDRLEAVQIPDPSRRARQYPMEFSGGMRQRAMIGMGLMGEPVLLVADEPTTALDVVVQREILELLRRVRDERGAGVLFISHDIGVIAEIASRVLVMYAGRIVEDLPVSLLHEAAHPYTRALVASVPDLGTDRKAPLATIPGRPPDPAARPAGCAFAPRCRFADAACRAERPPLEGFGDGRRVACFHPQAAAAGGIPVAASGGEEGGS